MGLLSKLRSIFSRKKEEEIGKEKLIQEARKAIESDAIEEIRKEKELSLPKNPEVPETIPKPEALPTPNVQGIPKKEEIEAPQPVKESPKEDATKELLERIEMNRLAIEDMKRVLLEKLESIEGKIEDLKNRLLGAGKALTLE